MAWPEDRRPKELQDRRVVIRWLRCTRGEAACVLAIVPRANFQRAASVMRVSGGLHLRVGSHRMSLWSSRPLQIGPTGAHAFFRLHAGEEVWAVLSSSGGPEEWNQERAHQALRQSVTYWQRCLGNLTYRGPREAQARRSALALHLLTYAPDGSLVAAPTTSLPERLGGNRNYDYRFAWVRDASLSLAVLSLLGDTETATRYLDWLCGLGSLTDAPLQVMYGLSGGLVLEQHERTDIAGYRSSLPVRVGNRAYNQQQRGSLGYLVDCAELHLSQGGSWKDDYWHLIRRLADYIAASWRQPDSSLWELPTPQHYVSSKVMDWVALDRAVRIARRMGQEKAIGGWQQAMGQIHAEVMELGWSERMGAFRQHYGADNLDAATLLIPITGFLPANHPRVLSTVQRIEDALTIDGFVYRFHPDETAGSESAGLPLGEYEGAFLPCTFWLATTYAMQGRVQDAETILSRAERIAGDLGLFSEEVDPRTGTLLGNMPLLFSQMEYVRTILAIAHARAAAGSASG